MNAHDSVLNWARKVTISQAGRDVDGELSPIMNRSPLVFDTAVMVALGGAASLLV